MASASRPRTAVPVLPSSFVSRPDLVAALDRGEDRALTLVCAPAGYGKTLLVADWVRRQDVACAWVALEEEDDDPQRLWTAILSALAACPAVPADSRLRELVVPRTAVGVDFLTELIEALDAVPDRVRLVLDDAHHLRSRRTLHGLRLLLRLRPRTTQLVLTSRSDPALPVARLRLEEQLCEVRTEQLGFSTGDTATLTDLCGLRLSPAQAGLLHARTEGWVAGIRLALLPLGGHDEPERFLEAFSGDDRPVADYLLDEVLAHIPADAGDLLRRISISNPVPAGLAAELSGRADAADMLAALERSTGLIVASGEHRSEFRIQELVRSYLSADLYRHGPALAARLHRQAALWWEPEGRPVEALSHAARAADNDLLTELLHRWAPELAARGEHTVLRSALAAAEATATAPDAWFPLVSALMSLGRGDLRAVHSEIALADLLETGADDADLATFRAATSGLAGMGRRVPDAPAARGNPALTALDLAGRGVTEVLAGGARSPDAPVVPADLEAALQIARDQDLGLLLIQCQAFIGAAAACAGDFARATGAAEAALSAAAGHGWQDSPWAAVAHAVLAHACVVRAAPERALRAADAGLRIGPDEQDAAVRFALRTARGGALFDTGDRVGGLLELQEAHAELGGRPVPGPLAAHAALLECRASLVLGSAAAASTSMGRLAGRDGMQAERTLVQAWSEAAAGAARQARATVVPILAGDLRPVLPSTLVEAWLVEVWGTLRLGDRPGARKALQAALLLAEPLDVLRPFALAGQGMRVLLVDQLGGIRDPSDFAVRCLSARRPAGRPPVPALSAREQDVLTELASLSNLGEIAGDLDVSVNTVKSHVRAIYGKLGVSTRREAVLTALEHGVLT